MESSEHREILDRLAVHRYLHQALNLQWCRDHPAACAILTGLTLLLLGLMMILLLRYKHGPRHSARR